MFARTRHVLSEAFAGLRRNLLMSFAVVLSVAVSLTLSGASLLLSDQVDLVKGEWTGRVEVSIFLCDGRSCPDITEEQRAELQQALESEPVVEQVFYESKEEAYDVFTEQFEDEPNLLEAVSPEAIPASYRVKLRDPEQFAVIRDRFEAAPGVETIVDQREFLEDFLRFTNLIETGAVLVSLIQLVAASVLIANTIRMTAYARREQTEVMKLVGASNWYVRLPFLIEGIVAGALGALVAWGLLAASVPAVTDGLRDDFAFVPFIGVDEVLAVGWKLILAGVVVAAISSLLALRRFLSV